MRAVQEADLRRHRGRAGYDAGQATPAEEEKEDLESMYKIATEASVKNDYDDLVAIAVRLGFDDIYESEDYLNKSIDKINDKIKKLKTTYAWVWYHADDDKKELIRAKIIESYK